MKIIKQLLYILLLFFIIFSCKQKKIEETYQRGYNPFLQYGNQATSVNGKWYADGKSIYTDTLEKQKKEVTFTYPDLKPGIYNILVKTKYRNKTIPNDFKDYQLNISANHQNGKKMTIPVSTKWNRGIIDLAVIPGNQKNINKHEITIEWINLAPFTSLEIESIELKEIKLVNKKDDNFYPEPGNITLDGISGYSAMINWEPAVDNNSQENQIMYKLIYSKNRNDLLNIKSAESKAVSIMNWETSVFSFTTHDVLIPGKILYFALLVQDIDGNISISDPLRVETPQIIQYGRDGDDINNEWQVKENSVFTLSENDNEKELVFYFFDIQSGAYSLSIDANSYKSVLPRNYTNYNLEVLIDSKFKFNVDIKASLKSQIVSRDIILPSKEESVFRPETVISLKWLNPQKDISLEINKIKLEKKNISVNKNKIKPASIEVQNITTSTADVIWTPSEDKKNNDLLFYKLVYSGNKSYLKTFDLASLYGTTILEYTPDYSNNSDLHLENLNPDTEYYCCVLVKSDRGEEIIYKPVYFRTKPFISEIDSAEIKTKTDPPVIIYGREISDSNWHLLYKNQHFTTEPVRINDSQYIIKAVQNFGEYENLMFYEKVQLESNKIYKIIEPEGSRRFNMSLYLEEIYSE